MARGGEMTMTTGTDLHVQVWGTGEPVLFVHASFGDGEQDWTAQRQLAARYRLLLLDRRGYGDSPPRETPATFDVRTFTRRQRRLQTCWAREPISSATPTAAWCPCWWPPVARRPSLPSP